MTRGKTNLCYTDQVETETILFLKQGEIKPDHHLGKRGKKINYLCRRLQTE
jgi:hypothetical protein